MFFVGREYSTFTNSGGTRWASHNEMYLVEKTILSLGIAVLLSLFLMPSAALAEDGCYDPPGDITGDATTNVLDVQCSIIGVLNSLLAEAPPACNAHGPLSADLNCDDVLSVADVQLTITLAWAWV